MHLLAIGKIQIHTPSPEPQCSLESTSPMTSDSNTKSCRHKMCCLIRSLLKCAICTINGLLALAFLIVALFGVLLKTAPEIYGKILEQLLGNIDNEKAKQIMIFIGENAGSAWVVFLLVGGCVSVFCFFGLFATTCHCRKGFKVYTGILGVCVIAEAIGLGYFFGDPKALPAKVTAIMDKALQDYGKPDVQLAGATFVWNYLMTSDEKYCCGLVDYKNFTERDPPVKDLPPACCYDATASKIPETCDAEGAEKANVPGCQAKIDTFLMEKKNLFLIAPIILVVFQAAVLALDIFAICTKAI